MKGRKFVSNLQLFLFLFFKESSSGLHCVLVLMGRVELDNCFANFEVETGGKSKDQVFVYIYILD